MIRAPIGDVMVRLGMLRAAQVEEVLAAMAAGEAGRFGEVAARMGLVSEDAVATALADQFGLRAVPADRVARLPVTPEVLAMVPRALVARHLVVPTFYDAPGRVLSLLVADPTEIGPMKEAQDRAGAERLRLFVSTPQAVADLVDRLLPGAREELSRAPSAHDEAPRAGLLVFEPDPRRARLLRELALTEDDPCTILEDPERVASRLDKGSVDRLLLRRSVAEPLGAKLTDWKRQHGGLSVATVDGYGPSNLPLVRPLAVRDFFFNLAEMLLVATETRQVELRSRVRRLVGLCREILTELRLPEDQADTAILAALFFHSAKMTLTAGLDEDAPAEGKSSRFDSAITLLNHLAVPFPVTELYDELDRRMEERGLPGEHLGAEVLFSALTVADLPVAAGIDAASLLDHSRHHARVIEALGRTLRREQLRAQLSTTGHALPLVVLAERDISQLSTLETRLSQAGFRVLSGSGGDDALALARAHAPVAVIANMRLPRLDGLNLIGAMRRYPESEEIPVFLLTDQPGPRDVARGLDLGAEDVLEKPVNVAILLSRLRRVLSRRSPHAEDAGVVGRLNELALVELLQTLSLGGRTAEVTLSGGPEPGVLHLDNGALVSARAGDLGGEEALYAMASQQEGRFAVRFDVPPGERDIFTPTEFLLLEAVRRVDEQRRSEP